jgi:hypothetical protein
MFANNKKYSEFLILLITLCFSISGCIRLIQNPEKSFSDSVAIPIHHFSKITYTGLSPIDTQTMISFDIENITGDCVELTKDPALIFIYYKNHWIKIPDNMEVTGVILGPKGSNISASGDSINPDYSLVPSSAYPLRMRVVILGRLCNNGVPSNETVGDYVELLVNKP